MTTRLGCVDFLIGVLMKLYFCSYELNIVGSVKRFILVVKQKLKFRNLKLKKCLTTAKCSFLFCVNVVLSYYILTLYNTIWSLLTKCFLGYGYGWVLGCYKVSL